MTNKTVKINSLDGVRENLRKYPVGFYILIAGAIWALVELVLSIMYFFG